MENLKELQALFLMVEQDLEILLKIYQHSMYFFFLLH